LRSPGFTPQRTVNIVKGRITARAVKTNASGTKRQERRGKSEEAGTKRQERRGKSEEAGTKRQDEEAGTKEVGPGPHRPTELRPHRPT
jgi:hypothetical protein